MAGYGALLLHDTEAIRVLSRSGKNMAVQFSEIVRDLMQLPEATAIDGELWS
jgi:ATP-dependent DNA ligase